MQSAREAREARRRKILERGNDRLSFITGQIHSLRPQTDPSSSSDLQPPPLNQNPNRNPTEEPTDVVEEEPTHVENRSAIESEAFQNERRKEISEVVKELLPLSSFPSSSASHEDEDKKLPAPTISQLFALQSLSRAIDSSASLRIFCTVGIAIYFVICGTLSEKNPSANILERFVPSWPIFLLIVSEITLVVAALLLTSGGRKSANVRKFKVAERDSGPGSFSIMGNMGDILQALFLFKKAATALYFDLSVYFVVLICGLSLSQYFF